MKTHIITLLILAAMVVSGCGVKYHARRASFHQRMFIAKGGKVDTTSSKVIDSAEIGGTELSGNTRQLPNEDSVKQYCRELLSDEILINPEPIREHPEVIRKEKPTAGKVITKIQKEVCPQEAIDSSYVAPISIQGKTYPLPIRVQIKAQGGRLEWSVKSGELSVPFVKEEKQPVIYTHEPLRNKLQWAFFGSLAGIAVTFGLLYFLRRKNKS